MRRSIVRNGGCGLHLANRKPARETTHLAPIRRPNSIDQDCAGLADTHDMKRPLSMEGRRSGASPLDHVPPSTALYDIYTFGIPLVCLIVIRTLYMKRYGPGFDGMPEREVPGLHLIRDQCSNMMWWGTSEIQSKRIIRVRQSD